MASIDLIPSDYRTWLLQRRTLRNAAIAVAVAAIAEPHMAPKMAFPAITEIANPPGK